MTIDEKVAKQLATIAQNEQKVYNAGIEQGKQAAYVTFWDSFQQNGTRNSYRYAFYSQGTNIWTDALYNPKYPIMATANYGGDSMFQASLITDTKVPITIGANASYTFLGCAFLVTIRKLIVSESTTFNSWFNGCGALINLTVEGVIAQNGLDFRWSTKLSRASHESIVAALSTTTTGLTVTFSKAAVNKAFETAEGANDGSTSAEWTSLKNTRTNWTIVLA